MKRGRSCLGVDGQGVEEHGAVPEGEAAPFPEAFFADEEVDVLSLEALVDRQLHTPIIRSSVKEPK